MRMINVMETYIKLNWMVILRSPKGTTKNLSFTLGFKGKILQVIQIWCGLCPQYHTPPAAQNDFERRIFQKSFIKALGEGSEQISDSSLSHSSSGIAQNDILINQ